MSSSMLSRRSLSFVSAIVCLSIVSAACGADGGVASEDGNGGETLSVVASFYPLAFASERVGGDAVSVANLTPPGAEPHDLELTPDDLEAIASADVVVYLGGGFQPAIDEAVEAEASGVAVDVLEGVELLPPPPEDDHAHEGDEEGEHEEEEGEHEGEELSADPHIWLDPTVFAGVVDRIAAALAQADAEHAEGFDEAAATMNEELAVLDAEFSEGLAECDTRVAITNHAAFGYLTAAYDLEQEAISGLTPESEPDPERLAELAEHAQEDGATTVFTEELLAPDVAETLAAEAGLATAVLNPIEGLTEEQLAAGDDYFTVMRENLEALREGLVCT